MPIDQPTRAKLAEVLAALSEIPADIVDWQRCIELGVFVEGRTLFIGRHRDIAGSWAHLVEDPRAAWETLASAGLIPQDWVESETRCFYGEPVRSACSRCKGSGRTRMPNTSGRRTELCTVCAGSGATTESWSQTLHPPTIAACIAIAADVAGILATEQLAREHANRLQPWGCPVPSRIAWYVREPSPWVTSHSCLAATRLFNDMAEHTPNADLDTVPPPPPHGPNRKLYDLELEAWRWRLLAEGAHDRKVRARFRGMPNPYEPLLALVELGYRLSSIGGPDMVLFAPLLRGKTEEERS